MKIQVPVRIIMHGKTHAVKRIELNKYSTIKELKDQLDVYAEEADVLDWRKSKLKDRIPYNWLARQPIYVVIK